MTVTEPYSTVGPPYDPPPTTPFVGPLESVIRHPFAAALPVVFLVAVALVIGLTRSPKYVSEARISVGRVDVPAFTLQNVVTGNQALAASYSRAMDVQKVMRDAGRRVGITPDQARSRLYASPIPSSTLIRVEASGKSRKDAARLANAGSRALIRYVTALQVRQQNNGLLEDYKHAQLLTDHRREDLGKLLKRKARKGLIETARLELLAAQLRSQRLSTLYNNANSGPTPPSPLQLLAPANSASSDFGSMLQKLLLIAVAAGLVIGVGLALALSNGARIRRRTT